MPYRFNSIVDGYDAQTFAGALHASALAPLPVSRAGPLGRAGIIGFRPGYLLVTCRPGLVGETQEDADGLKPQASQ